MNIPYIRRIWVYLIKDVQLEIFVGASHQLGGSNSNISYFHPGSWARWTLFDFRIVTFQMGWFNHQPVRDGSVVNHQGISCLARTMWSLQKVMTRLGPWCCSNAWICVDKTWIRLQLGRCVLFAKKKPGHPKVFRKMVDLKLSRFKGSWARIGMDKLNLNLNLESLHARDWIWQHIVEVLFFQIFRWNHPSNDLSESGRSGNHCHSSERLQVRSNVYMMSADLSKKH